MGNTQNLSYKSKIQPEVSGIQQLQVVPETWNLGMTLRKLRGGFFLVIGFLLSPMSWWNDLFFNLPVAYGFGYLCSFLSPNLLLPCSILGYWLSNIAGILLMQVGFVDVVQGEPKERNHKKELLMGLASSTIYTLVILLLMHLNILNAPALFPGS
jgi:hypothetical protein